MEIHLRTTECRFPYGRVVYELVA